MTPSDPNEDGFPVPPIWLLILMGVVTNQPTYDVAVHQLARQVFEWLARR